MRVSSANAPIDGYGTIMKPFNTFDSSRAWSQASQAVTANLEVVLALAGVFFLLPMLAFSLFFPAPETTAGMSEQQIVAMVGGYYKAIAPAVIPMALLQGLGTLALMCLLDSARRPTVGGAIRGGARGLLPYLVVQIGLGLVMGGIALLVVGGLGAVGGLPGGFLGIAITLLVIAVLSVRLSVTAPVIAVEHVFNPLAAAARSWALTRGQTARLLGFYALLLVVVLVVSIFANVLTIPFSLLLPAEPARLVAQAVQALVASATVVYSAAILAQVHAQLTGPSQDAQADLFG